MICMLQQYMCADSFCRSSVQAQSNAIIVENKLNGVTNMHSAFFKKVAAGGDTIGQLDTYGCLGMGVHI